MRSREQILLLIKAAKPNFVPLQYFSFDVQKKNTIKEFIEILTLVHVDVIELMDQKEVYKYLPFPSNPKNVFDVLTNNNADVPFDLEWALVEGRLGVAENGAIWVDTTGFSHKNAVAFFSCEQLALLLKKDNVVANMHEAYRNIPPKGFGYGVFIAGPSKTADIEQSLVIGAHGPKSLTVFLY